MSTSEQGRANAHTCMPQSNLSAVNVGMDTIFQRMIKGPIEVHHKSSLALQVQTSAAVRSRFASRRHSLISRIRKPPVLRSTR